MKHTPMTQEQLNAIRERVDASTAGPWQWWGEAELVSLSVPDSTSEDDYPRITNEDGQIDSSDDADLIEHAPDDLADLLAEVKRLRHFESIVSWRYGDTTDGKTREAMVEKAARTLYLREISWSSEAKWDRLPDPVKRMWRLKAEAVLDAALGTGEDA